MEKVKVFIDDELSVFTDVIISTFKNLFELAGVKVLFVEKLINADIAYSNSPLKDVPVIKSIDAKEWKRISILSNFVNYKKYKVPKIFLNHNNSFCNDIDWVACTYYYLSGFHESRINDLNEYGVPSSQIEFFNFHQSPIINDFSLTIRKLLSKLSFSLKPMWPNDKKYCVVLTHDLDRLKKFDYKARFKLSKIHFKNRQYKMGFNSLGKSLFSALNKSNSKDTYLKSIDSWFEYESKNNIKSAYYVATTNCFDAHSSINDVIYEYNDNELVEKIKDLHENGWENK